MKDFGIKIDKKEEWKKAVGENCLDGYSFGVVEATIKVFGALDLGKTPEDAIKEVNEMGISGFMAGCMAQWVSQFHIRGEEFRIFWNDKYGQKDSSGVINPAILTIKE